MEPRLARLEGTAIVCRERLALAAAFLEQTQLPSALRLLRANLAAAFCVGFGLARRRGVRSRGSDLYRNLGDADGRVGDRPDDATGEEGKEGGQQDDPTHRLFVGAS